MLRNVILRYVTLCLCYVTLGYVNSCLCFRIQMLSVRLPNAAGRGERISTDFTYGSKNAIGWSVNLTKPMNGLVQLP